MSSQELEVIVQVLDEKYKLSDFALKYIREELYEWEKGGITDPIGQLVTWLWGMIDEALTGLRQALEGFLTTIRDQIISGVTSFVDTIYKGILGAIDTVSSSINVVVANLGNIASFLNDFYNAVTSSLTSLSGMLTGIVDTLRQVWSILEGLATSVANAVMSGISQVQAWISKAIDGVLKSLGDVYNTIVSLSSQVSEWFTSLASSIAGIATSVYNYIQGFTTTLWINLQGAFSTIQNYIGSALTTVSQTLTQLGTTITTGIQSLALGFNELASALIGGYQKFTELVSENITTVQAFFVEQYNRLASSVTTITTTLQGFINPLVNIQNWLQNLGKNIVDMVSNFASSMFEVAKSVASIIWGGLQWVYEHIVNGIKSLASFIWNALRSLGEALFKVVSSGIKALWDGLQATTVFVEGLFKSALEATIEPFSTVFATYMFKPFIGESPKISTPDVIGRKLDETTRLMITSNSMFAGLAFSPIYGQLLIRRLTWGLRSLASTLKTQALKVELAGEPVGVGAKGKFSFRLALASTLYEFADNIEKWMDEFYRGIIYGLTIWTWQPLSKVFTYWFRDIVPILLPEEATIREYIQRLYPSQVGVKELQNIFNETWEVTRYYMGLHGYSSYVVNWFFKKPEEMHVKVKDRFGVERKLPISLIWSLPTGSELCRMMVRDIFGLPENPFPSFANAIAMRGYNVDVASMYYMLHFRYPPMEKLWEFSCRCAVGLAWVTEKPTIEGKPYTVLGYGEAKAPVELNANVTSVEALISHLNSWISNYLKYYSKWHDYAPFTWVKGFTADRLIIMDLMADIPMRIDVRWMYKWKIVEDMDVFRIVVARGMHPRWVEKITVAECMNALMEERTFARTGVINAYKEGFTTEELLTRTLAKLTTVKILGKEWDVRFLEGEIKLLALRARYDRSLDILRDYSRELIRSVADNILTFQNITENLSRSISFVADSLKINLSFDASYFEAYKPVVSTMFNIYTVHRVRIWIRYMMYRILTRFSEGYLTRSEVEKFINDVVEKGKLTELEKTLLQDVADIMLQYFMRQTKANAILKKLSRGAIKIDEARRELAKLGLEKETIDALIEERAKLYTISIDKLVSMMEYIPVDINKLKEKMELMGVPEDEKALYIPYALAREIKSELDRYVSEILKDYEDGVIDRREAERELEGVATLWGQAKQVLGVDWVLYSPDERKILLMVYDRKRARKERRGRR